MTDFPQTTTESEQIASLIHKVFMAGYECGKKDTDLQMVIVSDVIEPKATADMQTLLKAARINELSMLQGHYDENPLELKVISERIATLSASAAGDGGEA